MGFKLLVGGQLVDGASAIDVINPADETVVASCPVADQTLLDQAVSAAKKAQPGWAATPLKERAACLKKLGAVVAEHEAEISRIITQEMGRPLPLAHFEAQLVQKSCAFYSE